MNFKILKIPTNDKNIRIYEVLNKDNGIIIGPMLTFDKSEHKVIIEVPKFLYLTISEADNLVDSIKLLVNAGRELQTGMNTCILDKLVDIQKKNR